MKTPLRILYLEDNENDAVLVQTMLEREDFACIIDRVEALADFTSALQKNTYDIILSDFTLPSYDGASALKLVTEKGVDTPYIFVSGTIGEGPAIESLLHGATDYVLKNNLSRLVPAVRRALRETEERKKRKKAELDLRESEARYRRLFEAAKDGILILDADTGRIMDVNPFLTELLGFSHEQLRGKLIWELGFFKDIAASKSNFLELQQKGYVRYEDLPLEAASGHHLNVEFVSNVYQVDNRRVIQCNVRDITERKKLEEARLLLTTALESTANGVVITDVRGDIVWVNKAFIGMTGYARAEVVGQNPRILKSGKQEDSFYRQLWETISRGNIWRGELINKRKNGSLYIDEMTITPLKANGGKVTNFIAVKQDITDRKKAEDSLKSSEERLRILFESAPDGIFLIDLTGTFIDGNKRSEEIVGYNREELIGTNLFSLHLTRKGDLLKVTKLLAKNAAGSPYGPVEFMLYRKNGSQVPVEVRTYPVTIGGKTQVLGVARDITERKQAEEVMKNLARFPSENPNPILRVDDTGTILYANEASESLLKEWNSRIGNKLPVTLQKYIGGSGAVIDEFNVKSKIYSLKFASIAGKGYVNIYGNDVTDRRKAEQALERTVGQLKNLFDNLDEVFFSFDPINNKLLQISPSCERLYGYTQESFIADPLLWFKVIHQEDRSRIEDDNSQLAKGIPKQWECRIVRRSGEVRWIDTKAKPTLDAGGRVIRIDGIVADITERKRTLEVLHESERRFREMLENVQLIAMTLDRNGAVTFCNDYFLALTGWKGKEVIGVEWFTRFLPEGGVNERKVFFESLAAGTIAAHYENPIVTKSGELREIRWNNTLLRDSAGNIDGTASIGEDVTDQKRAAKRLDEERSLLRTMIEAIPDEICVKDRERRFILANSGSVRSLRRNSFEEIAGKKDEDLIRPEFARDAAEEEETIFRTGKPLLNKEPVSVFDKKTGKIDRAILTSKVPIIDASGAITGIVVINRDISNLKRSAEELAQRERRFRALIEHSGDRIGLIGSDGTVLYASPSSRRISGHGPDELVGTNAFQWVHPDDVREAQNAFREILKTPGGTLSIEYRIKHKDGTWKWMEVKATNLLNDPDVGGIVLNELEITERKLAEEALALQRSYFEQLFADSPYGIVLLDGAEHVLNVNRAFERVFQYSLEELKGCTLTDYIVAEESREEAKRITQRSMEGELVQMESVRRRKDGSQVEVAITGYPITIKGKIVGMYRVFVDISGRKVLEQQLLQAQKLEGIGTLAGGIAHDFNNILGIILAYITMLDKLTANPAKLADAVDAITKAVQRGASLVRQLLTFARQTDIRLEPVSVNVVVQELTKMLRATFPRTIELNVEMQKDVPQVTADQTQLHQLLLNLSVNARDAMPEGGTISVKTELIGQEAIRPKFPEASEERYVHISVSDTGTGMSRETMSRIFDPFFTTKEAGKGTGLGLAVVYGVTKSHGGFIDVQSEIGKGTTFDIYLPVRAAPTTEPIHVKGIHEEPGGTETILLVEDEESLLSMVQSILEAKGYKVLTAVDGVEALESYKSHREEINLVVSDMGLPKLGGWQAALRMKQINRNVQVIFASGFLEPGMKSAMEQEGFRNFIQKPYDLAEILRKVRNVLNAKENSA